MKTSWQASMLLVCLIASSMLLSCSAELSPSDVSNATSPAPTPAVFVNSTDLKELELNSTKLLGSVLNSTNAANSTNGTDGIEQVAGSPSARIRAVAVPEGNAVVDLPFPRSTKNAPDLNTTDSISAADDTGYAASVTSPPSFYQANLDIHNSYRAKHQNTPALVWNDSVASSAYAYASKCIWGHDSSNNQYGENLYAYSLDNNKAQFQETGLRVWYDEISQYDFGNQGFSEATGKFDVSIHFTGKQQAWLQMLARAHFKFASRGHFTQMVWKSTTRLGCAVVSCPNGLANWSPGRVYLVCRYAPPGNYLGRFNENVMPLGKTTAPAPAQTPQPAPQPTPSPTKAPSPPLAPPVTTPAAPAQTSVIRATVLLSGRKLSEGHCLPSPNQKYKLCMRDTGDVALLNGQGTTRWSSPSSSLLGTFYATVEPTGWFSVRSGSRFGFGFDMPVWSSQDEAGDAATPRLPCRLLVQDNGILALKDSTNRVIWSVRA